MFMSHSPQRIDLSQSGHARTTLPHGNKGPPYFSEAGSTAHKVPATLQSAENENAGDYAVEIVSKYTTKTSPPSLSIVTTTILSQLMADETKPRGQLGEFRVTTFPHSVSVSINNLQHLTSEVSRLRSSKTTRYDRNLLF